MKLSDSVTLLGNKISLWWKDIHAVGTSIEENHINWFSSSIGYRLGNDDLVDFWRDRWLGFATFCSMFEMLFHQAGPISSKILNKGFWSDSDWQWQLNF